MRTACLTMRTACLTMMKIMLIEIPGVRVNSFPGLWYTFSNMGMLLDALNEWPRPLVGQMAAVYEFFNNPQWLLTDPLAIPNSALWGRPRTPPLNDYVYFPNSFRVSRNDRMQTSTGVRIQDTQNTASVRFLR